MKLGHRICDSEVHFACKFAGSSVIPDQHTSWWARVNRNLLHCFHTWHFTTVPLSLVDILDGLYSIGLCFNDCLSVNSSLAAWISLKSKTQLYCVKKIFVEERSQHKIQITCRTPTLSYKHTNKQTNSNKPVHSIISMYMYLIWTS